MAVPHAWLDDYAEYFGEDTSGGSATIDYERLANTPTGKHKADGSAMSLWEDFLAGTDPTNSASVFTAKIEVRDGKPVVTWEPDLNENGTKFERVYKVYGRERFGSGSEWEYPTNSLHRFFKISVEMP